MRTFRLFFLAVIIQAHTSVRETKLYENLTYVPLAAGGYPVKLQSQEYTEQCMPDNNIHIYKIAIQLTPITRRARAMVKLTL